MPVTPEIERHPLQPTQLKRIEVVAAVIFDERGRIFATQRGYGEWKDWWEFPAEKKKSSSSMRSHSAFSRRRSMISCWILRKFS